MQTHFSKEQFDSNYPDGIENHFWISARNRIIAQEIRKIAKLDSVVLDVGCGRGVAVKYLRNDGIDCVGVEPAKVRPLAGVGEHIHFGKNATELSGAERARYDIILLLDVIEHIREPIPLLRDLMKSFPNLAYVIVTVPAHLELWSNYDEFYGHYRRYTIEMIESLCKQLGVELAWKGYFFRSLYIPMRMLTRIGIRRSIRVRPPHGIIKWMHKLFSLILVCEHHVFPRSVPGASIIACLSSGKCSAREAGVGA